MLWLSRPGARAPAGLLFDLDGTLVDSVPDLAQAVDATLLQMQLPPAGEAAVRMWIGNGASMLLRRALAAATGCLPQQLPASLLQTGLNVFFGHYEKHCCRATVMYPGVSQALVGLQQRGVAMACVTNKPARFTDPLLRHFGLQQFFPVALSGDSLAQKKPDPAPLLAAIQGLGLTPPDCVMVGDSGTDVGAARNAGIPVIVVSYGYSQGIDAADLGADGVVDSLLELLG